ncbi:CRISPR-associated protein Csm3 [Methylomarinovum tepidoasis]|uniref:CRISPR system Cms endoribonuclease Csm3 n=1 Tax=Methylomarinovum tepidoasis TaxID=2840183 RepID=A0AAU9BYV1_9GAMM|nr:type III-A CRISPR-associated RAMP protein Csm3 [Methylomarinovum sp. IN45]BCX88940.1 CRISPR-associated protein Csm3 [Methylomarinovum sp. IN45]
MKLDKIANLEGTIELVTGLHIGSGNAEMHIGGTDSPVIKNPVTGQPYIPGSSLKGKMRSLMEWHAGVVAVARGKPLGIQHLDQLDGNREAGLTILKLFGYAPTGGGMDRDMEALVTEIGPTRLSFWDCGLDPAWVEEMQEKNLLLTETKMENMIDRIRGVAEHPRNTERVPAGARFNFRLTLKVIDGEDLLPPVLRGLKLVELSGLGGSVSRGYGKIAFRDLHLDGQPIQDRLNDIQL